MVFLLIIPVAFVLANLWNAWAHRTRRAPEIDETIAAHERFRAALRTEAPTGRRRR